MSAPRTRLRRLVRYTLLAGLLLVVAFLAQQCAFHATLAEWQQKPDPKGMVTAVAGASLFAVVTGNGAPVIVLEAGFGSRADTWEPLQHALAGAGTVLAYDRGDYGWSQTANYPRSPEALSRELGELLDRLRLDGPIVLVGHSFGAQQALHHALLLPQRQRVRGLVLVDPGPLGGDAAMRRLAALPGLAPTSRQFVASLADQEALFATEWLGTSGLLYRLYQLSSGAPEHLGTVLNASSSGWYRAMRSEQQSMRTEFTADQLERLGGFGLVLITANPAARTAELAQSLPQADSDRLVAEYRQGQLGYLRLCPTGRHVESQGGDHDIHRREPELVAAAVKSLVP